MENHMSSYSKQHNDLRIANIAAECRKQAKWEGATLSKAESLALARDIFGSRKRIGAFDMDDSMLAALALLCRQSA